MRGLLFVVALVALASSCDASLSLQHLTATGGKNQEVSPRELMTKEVKQKSKDAQGELAVLEKLTSLVQTKYGHLVGNTSAVTCDTCIHLADEYFYALRVGNASFEELVKVFNHECEALYNGTDSRVCDDIADVFLVASHLIVDFIQRFKFNLTQVMCTDIFHACTVDCCTTRHMPEQIHIGFPTTGDAVTAGQMAVTWSVLDVSTTPVVQYRKNGTNGQWSVSAAQHNTYTVSGWSGQLYGAVMTGLETDTVYEYRVGDSTTMYYSAPITFRTLHQAAGWDSRPLRIATYADMGTGGTHGQTLAQLKKLVDNDEIDLIVHTGDISYADGDSHRWDRFMRELQPICSRVPYMVIPGNHELLYNFTAYRTRFFMNPSPATLDGAPSDAMYYSFSVGPIFFLLLDSESTIDLPQIGAVQLDWATRMLTKAHTAGQFIYAGLHRPIYCSDGSMDCTDFTAYLRLWLEDLFYTKQVGIVHTGHVHNYERSFPVYKSKAVAMNYVNTTAPVSYVDGSPGCEEGLSSFHNTTKPGWSAIRIKTTSFLRMTMSGAANREGTMWSYTVKSDLIASNNATVIDSIDLTKNIATKKK